MSIVSPRHLGPLDVDGYPMRFYGGQRFHIFSGSGFPSASATTYTGVGVQAMLTSFLFDPVPPPPPLVESWGFLSL
jgi:hypothetical protein